MLKNSPLPKITEDDRLFAKMTILQFEQPQTPEQIFYELCFAICAPQTTFKSNLKVNSHLMAVGFYKNNIEKERLEEIVKPARFYRNKARFLLEAKNKFETILEKVNQKGVSPFDKREYLIKNINGLGPKAASHFLRNLGYNSLAIIDTHVLKFLEVGAPKSLWEYYDIESRFSIVAADLDLTIAELDALVWKYYSGTDWRDFIH